MGIQFSTSGLSKIVSSAFSTQTKVNFLKKQRASKRRKFCRSHKLISNDLVSRVSPSTTALQIFLLHYNDWNGNYDVF